ncbi:MAG: hypothetical protein GX560_11335 [Deinococcales bacterium]|nr:hypothetical protein [Deinococcales bacterium]
MRTELLLVCLAVGVGTYLFRYLPTRFGATQRGAGEEPATELRGPLGAFLASVGVAAVAALLVAALVGVLEPPAAAAALTAGPLGPRSASALTAALGVAATLGVYRWRRDVAAATLLGAAAYGLAWWLVTGVAA